MPDAPEEAVDPEIALKSYKTAAARGYTFRPDLVPGDLPIVEAFGYPPDADTPQARDARERCWCPFVDGPCTKLLSSAGTAVCSLRYGAEGFAADTVWAVCQHRLKGAPFQEAIDRHFGARAPDARLVTELRVKQPRLSLDGVGVLVHDRAENDVEVVGIEAQTIDTRGGSVKGMWNAYVQGRPDSWRDEYSDGVKFGVNTTNVWKRLLPQVTGKARLYKGWDSKLYVLVHDPVFQFLTRRMALERLPKQSASKAEIVWLRWDYEEGLPRDDAGMLKSGIDDAVHTTIEQVESAFLGVAHTPRNEFVRSLLKKLGPDLV